MTALPPFTLAALVGVLALALLLRVAMMRLPEGPAGHWLLLFGIAVVPGIALILGTNRALVAMERPQFCGSCHVMGPWVADLHDPASTKLAAVHYQNRFIRENQCYTCHTDYAMFGPMRAKLTGLVHFAKYVTGSYQQPIELYEPYHFSNCLQCHGESKRYVDKHTDVAAAIADGSMTCVDCHAPVHPEQQAKR
jgi:nitrate/TMAO reductase-like tetraheme cytochrome c subunit